MHRLSESQKYSPKIKGHKGIQCTAEFSRELDIFLARIESRVAIWDCCFYINSTAQHCNTSLFLICN